MLNKKAQAAMEFLMTYGWAVLVVLAAIGALAYFGVLSPNKYLPEKCTLPSGIACLDFKVSTSETTLILSNYFGKDININTITVGECSKNFNRIFENGEQAEFLLECNNEDPGTKFSEDVTINYFNIDSGMDKTMSGTISTKII